MRGIQTLEDPLKGMLDYQEVLEATIQGQALSGIFAKTGLLFPRVYYSGGTGMGQDGSSIWGIYYFGEGPLYGRGVYLGSAAERQGFLSEPRYGNQWDFRLRLSKSARLNLDLLGEPPWQSWQPSAPAILLAKRRSRTPASITSAT